MAPVPCGTGAIGRLVAQSSAAAFANADLRLAAWFLWMTPLLTALSSFRPATRSASFAASLSPEAAASRKERTAVFSEDLTDLLRRRRFSLVTFRLIWDLMFATRRLSVNVPARSPDRSVRAQVAPGPPAVGTPSGRGPDARTTERASARTLPNIAAALVVAASGCEAVEAGVAQPGSGRPGAGRPRVGDATSPGSPAAAGARRASRHLLVRVHARPPPPGADTRFAGRRGLHAPRDAPTWDDGKPPPTLSMILTRYSQRVTDGPHGVHAVRHPAGADPELLHHRPHRP